MRNALATLQAAIRGHTTLVPPPCSDTALCRWGDSAAVVNKD